MASWNKLLITQIALKEWSLSDDMNNTEAPLFRLYLAGFVVVVFTFTDVVLFGRMIRSFISETKIQEEDGRRENDP